MKPIKLSLNALFVVLLSLALLPLVAGAAPACRHIFDEAVTTEVDPAYLEVLKSWPESLKDSPLYSLLGRDWKVFQHEHFRIEDFQQARQFRNWVEFQNRTLDRLHLENHATPARVKLPNSPQEALAAKLLAIRQAKHTIDLTYYIVRADKTGLALMQELKNALRRGVSVRFVVDSTGTLGMTPHSQLRSLIEFAQKEAGYVKDFNGKPTTKKATVEVVVFNSLTSAPQQIAGQIFKHLSRLLSHWIPLKFDPAGYSWNRRSHDKLLLVDGAFGENAIAFIGGRNVSDAYYGVPKVDEHTYVDFEVIVKGTPLRSLPASQGRETLEPTSIGTQFSEYFDSLYFHLGNKVLTRSLLGLAIGYKRQTPRMEEAHRDIEQILGLDKDPDGVRKELLETGFADHHVDVVHTLHNIYRTKASRPREMRDLQMEIKNGKALMQRLEELIPQENKEIMIVSPYLWMSARQVRLLKAWLLKDPQRKLTVVTNSALTSDNMPAQVLVDNVIGPQLMLDRGLRNSKGQQFRRSVADQVKMYQYGKLDAMEFGGPVGYGKLHAKGLYLVGSKVALIGTHNNDPRSLLLNSEGAAVIRGAAMGEKFEAEIRGLIDKSHLWGSEEYHAIRARPELGVKGYVAQKSRTFYDLMMRLNLWWLF